jgi:hypothetical protein
MADYTIRGRGTDWDVSADIDKEIVGIGTSVFHVSETPEAALELAAAITRAANRIMADREMTA